MTQRLRISNIKLPLAHTQEDLAAAVRREGITCGPEDIKIVRKSLDARDKSDIRYIYTVEADPARVKSGKKAMASKKITRVETEEYRLPEPCGSFAGERPVICGLGPAGLFAGLVLAAAGLKPLIIERGRAVEERAGDIAGLWERGSLNEESNVCFGEGGAGTYSDGKLSTGNKDRGGRQGFILDTFADCGAAEEIRYWYQPHIGSDVLPAVVKNLRNRIISLGGEVQFGTKLTDLIIKDGRLTGISILQEGRQKTVPCDALILAAGHGAADVYQMLQDCGVKLEQKPFAMGLRIEHPQAMIQTAQFGTEDTSLLPVASYKLVTHTGEGRNVFSFCMCPGGHVVNASTHSGQTVVNGMSLSGRRGRNANSAIVVSVGPQDYRGDDPLAGLAFQKEYEQLAFLAGKGAIPVQLFGDYTAGKRSDAFGGVQPDIRGAYCFADLNRVLPDAVNRALAEAMGSFAKTIRGFDRPDAVLSGIESRTSSPVRVVRDERYESSVKGLFPCGEGAGYAGGIMSAAADGMKVAEEIIRRKQL